MPYQKIVLALAGNQDEAVAIQEAVRLSGALDAHLSVVHINDPKAGKISMMMPSPQLVTEEDLRKQCREAGYAGVADTIDVQVEVGVSFAKTIAKVTADADMLIMGHHKQHPLVAPFKDSTDEDVMNLVQCPILVVPLD